MPCDANNIERTVLCARVATCKFALVVVAWRQGERVRKVAQRWCILSIFTKGVNTALEEASTSGTERATTRLIKGDVCKQEQQQRIHYLGTDARCRRSCAITDAKAQREGFLPVSQSPP